MIDDHPFELGGLPAFLRLRDFQPGFETFVKIEGLNPAGSIKNVPARAMVDAAEASGLLRDGAALIESTSGNLGIALAAVCAAKGIRLVLVTDPNANNRSVRHMRALGAEVVVVTERDRNGGYLQTRVDYIVRRTAEDPHLLWLNQYANPANPSAHRSVTAAQISRYFGAPDWLFVAAGSTGTLMGCVEHFHSITAPTTIVGVDTAGSVTFGGPAGRRWIPGAGASRRPELFVDDHRFEKCVVAEAEVIRQCRLVAGRYGVLVGGSTGAVLGAVEAMRDHVAPGSRVVAISPDLGDRYLDTVYDDDWVRSRFGPDVLDHVRADHALTAGS